MNTLTISPVQWSEIKDIDYIEPISERDTDCLLEIREVLRKYKKMERFGVALLHQHFDLAEDEIMLETSDHETRTLTSAPVKQLEAGNTNIGTIWMLRDGDITTMTWCRQYCKRGIFGNHFNSHTKAR